MTQSRLMEYSGICIVFQKWYQSSICTECDFKQRIGLQLAGVPLVPSKRLTTSSRVWICLRFLSRMKTDFPFLSARSCWELLAVGAWSRPAQHVALQSQDSKLQSGPLQCKPLILLVTCSLEEMIWSMSVRMEASREGRAASHFFSSDSYWAWHWPCTRVQTTSLICT